jgi:hypothetical protein
MPYLYSSHEESMMDATNATREWDNEDRNDDSDGNHDDLSCFEDNFFVLSNAVSLVMIANGNDEDNTDDIGIVFDEAAPFGYIAPSN